MQSALKTERSSKHLLCSQTMSLKNSVFLSLSPLIPGFLLNRSFFSSDDKKELEDAKKQYSELSERLMEKNRQYLKLQVSAVQMELSACSCNCHSQQSTCESTCEVSIHIEITPNYHNKNMALRPALKERLRARNWSIGPTQGQRETLAEVGLKILPLFLVPGDQLIFFSL